MNVSPVDRQCNRSGIKTDFANSKIKTFLTWMIQEAKNKEYPIESLSSPSAELNIGSPVSELAISSKILVSICSVKALTFWHNSWFLLNALSVSVIKR